MSISAKPSHAQPALSSGSGCPPHDTPPRFSSIANSDEPICGSRPLSAPTFGGSGDRPSPSSSITSIHSPCRTPFFSASNPRLSSISHPAFSPKRWQLPTSCTSQGTTSSQIHKHNHHWHFAYLMQSFLYAFCFYIASFIFLCVYRIVSGSGHARDCFFRTARSYGLLQSDTETRPASERSDSPSEKGMTGRTNAQRAHDRKITLKTAARTHPTISTGFKNGQSHVPNS